MMIITMLVPRNVVGATWEQLEAIGFYRLPSTRPFPYEDDVIPVRLPLDWTVAKDTLTYLVDQNGNERAAIVGSVLNIYSRYTIHRIVLEDREAVVVRDNAPRVPREIYRSDPVSPDNYGAAEAQARGWLANNYPQYRNRFAHW